MTPRSKPQIIDQRGNRVYPALDSLKAFYEEQVADAMHQYMQHAPESHDHDLSDDDRMQQDFAGLEG